MRLQVIKLATLVTIVVASLSPGLAMAKEPRLYVKQHQAVRECRAGITEHGPYGSLVVAARQYAKCIDAYYEWQPAIRTFTLRKFSPSVLGAWADVKAVFTLDAPTVNVFLNDRHWMDFDIQASTGVIAFERDGDLANMVPLRFVNDLFRLGTLWNGESRNAHTVMALEPLDMPPVWDRTRIQELNLARSGSLAWPLQGSPLLPSTTRRLEWFAPYAEEMEQRAIQAERPYEVNWTAMSFRYLPLWGEKAIAEFSIEDGYYVSTAWFHSASDARAVKKTLEQNKSLWEAGTGYTTQLGVVATAVTTVYMPEVTIPLAAFSALTGSGWVAANRYYSVKLADIETCMEDAAEYAEEHETDFAMGLSYNEAYGFRCLVRYET